MNCQILECKLTDKELDVALWTQNFLLFEFPEGLERVIRDTSGVLPPSGNLLRRPVVRHVPCDLLNPVNQAQTRACFRRTSKSRGSTGRFLSSAKTGRRSRSSAYHLRRREYGQTPSERKKEAFIHRIEHVCVPYEPNVQGWVVYGGCRCAQHTESQGPSPKSARKHFQSIVRRRIVVDSVPFQSEFQEPDPACLRIQGPSEGRECIGNIGTLLDFKLKLPEGPQQPKVDLQLGRDHEGGRCDGFTNTKL